MNGRIYDPMLRTFLSPDVNLLDPENSQHYNRYSYGLNNPLMYMDPSGDELYSMPSYNIPTYSFPLYNIPFNSMSSTNMISFLNSFNVANFVSTGYGYLDNLFNPYSPGDPFLMDKNMQSTNDYLNDIDFNNPNIIELEEIVIKGKPMTDLISSPIKDLTGNVNWDGINNSLQVADGFGFGAAMGKQFSIDYRLSQSLMDRVGMSANIKAIDFLGTASNWLGTVGNIGMGIDTILDYQKMQNGYMSNERFGYNFNPIAGGVVGSSFYVGQQFYDGYMYWAEQMSIGITNFNNWISNPARYSH